MLRYLARRLLLLPATLLGIALVGFALVELLPGDPALAQVDPGQAQGLSAEDLARWRSLYGLDLPLLVNTRVMDRGRRVTRLVADLEDPGRSAAAEASLRVLGTLALPELARSDTPKALALARELLGLAPAAPKEEILRAYEAASSGLAGKVRRFLEAPGADSERALLAAGSAAVAPLARAYLEGRGETAATARVLSALTPFSPPAHHQEVRAAFASWWRERRLEFEDLSGPERVWASLSETRLGRWLGRLVRLDFGENHEGRPVGALLAEALPLTLLLGLLALLSAYGVAIPLGSLGAARSGGTLDRTTLALTLGALALPAPWVAVALISLAGALPFDLFPLHGITSPGAESWGFFARAGDLAWHLVLPVSCLAYGTAALLLRYQRGAVLAAMAQGFVQAARARGLRERTVVFRHALRAGLGPAISLLAVELPWVLSGSVVVETAFDLPGMGLLTWRALFLRDYPTLLGAVMVLALTTVVASLVADLLAAWADPRLALARRRA
jgi:peptide/nickel transport system permease protein